MIRAKTINAFRAAIADVSGVAEGAGLSASPVATHALGADIAIAAGRRAFLIERACLTVRDPALEHLHARLGRLPSFALCRVTRDGRERVETSPRLLAIERQISCVPRGPIAVWRRHARVRVARSE